MHLQSLYIGNFRSFKELSMKFRSGANLIVGPNAVGKTTVLEAIRLTKALLAPRTAQESQYVLSSLGVLSPQLPQRFNFAALAKDTKLPVEISCVFGLSNEEIKDLPALFDELCRSAVAAQRGISLVTAGPLALVQFLSSAPGQQALKDIGPLVEDQIQRVTKTQECTLGLKIDPKSGISGQDSFSQLLFSTIEARMNPYKTQFSYFPADRAMPTGEIPIQLGTIDAVQQLESHSSTPAGKYQRLKTTIFACMVESPESKELLERTFQDIFRKLLLGRELGPFGVNQYGQATISVKDSSTGELFDIDSMSSGEKGLILTFLLIARSIDKRGLILLDEPELHLNPAVCKSLLAFLLDEFLLPNDIQAIICSHSPEIFSAAMRREECTAYHLRTGSRVSEVRKKDQPEVAQTLRLLGTSEVEEMLYEGVMFVEGEDDVDLLEEAFPELLAKFKFRELSGRGELEKHIKKLQEAEQLGQKENISYFVFDHDNKPTELKSTDKVRVKQWDRYCLENYLLDPAVIFDVIQREKCAREFPSNLGEALKEFEGLAKSQLSLRVIREIYAGLKYDDPGIRSKDILSKTPAEAATVLFARLNRVKTQFENLDEKTWKEEFVAKCDILIKERDQEWLNSWRIICSGKQFFRDLYVRFSIKIAPVILKRRILTESKLVGSEGWKLLQAKFRELIENR
jgi:predicted ATPase